MHGPQDLDGNVSFEHRVQRPKHAAHPTSPEFGLDLVATHLTAGLNPALRGRPRANPSGDRLVWGSRQLQRVHHSHGSDAPSRLLARKLLGFFGGVVEPTNCALVGKVGRAAGKLRRVSASAAEKLVEAARTLLEAGEHGQARSKLREALAAAPSDDAELMTDLLSVSVEAAHAAGEPGEALTFQLDLLKLVEAAGDPYDIGEEYERLAELHFDRAKADLTPEAIMDADEAFATAHARYVEADGPNTTDAIDAVAGRLSVAHLGADIDGMGDRAAELVGIAKAIEGGPRIKNRVAEILDRAAAQCREFGGDQEADALGRASAKLTGKPYEPPAPPKPLLGGGGGGGGLAALLGGGGGDGGDDDDGDFGIDALLRAASGGGGGGGGRADPGKKRSERLLDLLEKAQTDADLRMDAPKRISKLEDVAQRYVQMVFERNSPISDEDAAATLEVSTARLSESTEMVEVLLDELLR